MRFTNENKTMTRKRDRKKTSRKWEEKKREKINTNDC